MVSMNVLHVFVCLFVMYCVMLYGLLVCAVCVYVIVCVTCVVRIVCDVLRDVVWFACFLDWLCLCVRYVVMCLFVFDCDLVGWCCMEFCVFCVRFGLMCVCVVCV